MGLIKKDETYQKLQPLRHCIGMDPGDVFQRHGKVFYLAYRNYFGGEDKALAEAAKAGYAAKSEGREYPTYHLTERGLHWLGGILGVEIHERYGWKEPEAVLTDSDREDIKEFWKIIRDSEAYAFNDTEHLDVKVLFDDMEALWMFKDEYSGVFDDGGAIDCEFNGYGIMFSAVDFLEDHVLSDITAAQLWEMKPAGVREEL